MPLVVVYTSLKLSFGLNLELLSCNGLLIIYMLIASICHHPEIILWNYVLREVQINLSIS